jgi:hypothetical protein
MVAITRYVEGAAWRPRPLTPGQAVLALLEDTLPAQLDPDGSLRVLRRTVGAALALKGPRGQADETARQLLSVLTRRSAHAAACP